MAHKALTEEELALLGHAELTAEEGVELEQPEDYPAAGFHERLMLGDLSW